MTTSLAVDSSASSSPDETQVLWWRNAAGDVDVPRGHGVGWATADGSEHGQVTLLSEHLRLDPDQIHALLTSELGPRSYRQLTRVEEPVAPLVRLYAEGHVVVELDLADHFGPDCMVGVAVELRGRGIAARIAYKPGLTKVERDAALSWAESQIQRFPVLSQEAALDANGWTQLAPSRWQITANLDISTDTL